MRKYLKPKVNNRWDLYFTKLSEVISFLDGFKSSIEYNLTIELFLAENNEMKEIFSTFVYLSSVIQMNFYSL